MFGVYQIWVLIFKLDGVGPVDNRPYTNKLEAPKYECDMRHFKHYT